MWKTVKWCQLHTVSALLCAGPCARFWNNHHIFFPPFCSLPSLSILLPSQSPHSSSWVWECCELPQWGLEHSSSRKLNLVHDTVKFGILSQQCTVVEFIKIYSPNLLQVATVQLKLLDGWQEGFLACKITTTTILGTSQKNGPCMWHNQEVILKWSDGLTSDHWCACMYENGIILLRPSLHSLQEMNITHYNLFDSLCSNICTITIYQTIYSSKKQKKKSIWYRYHK